VAIRLRGVQSNRDGIGARLIAQSGGRVQTLEICGGDGFFACNERRQLIGLDDADRLDRLEIVWPSGIRQIHEGLRADIEYTVTEGSGTPMISVRRPATVN
jgi:hypothetical protein